MLSPPKAAGSDPQVDVQRQAAPTGGARLRTTCLVNCYNYAGYVEEAIESALAQTRAFDELIVVDDGSTDGSVGAIEAAFARHGESARSTATRLVSKSNGGQLSSFHAGLAEATGDIVFFLDADDAYVPEYVERVMRVFEERREIGFVTVGYRTFGATDELDVDKRGSRDLGYSLVNALGRRGWVGGPTSTLSMRRAELERFMPLPEDFLEDWRISADDCLVLGMSVAGARKYYLAEPLMRYRQHGTNSFLGRDYDRNRDFQKKMAAARLLDHLARHFNRNLDLIGDAIHREFCTVERPSFRELRQYLRIASKMRVPRFKGPGIALCMWRHFLAERRR